MNTSTPSRTATTLLPTQQAGFLLANASNFDLPVEPWDWIELKSTLGGYNFILGAGHVPALFDNAYDAEAWAENTFDFPCILCTVAVNSTTRQIEGEVAFVCWMVEPLPPLSQDEDYLPDGGEHPTLSCEEQEDGYDYDRYY